MAVPQVLIAPRYAADVSWGGRLRGVGGSASPAPGQAGVDRPPCAVSVLARGLS